MADSKEKDMKVSRRDFLRLTGITMAGITVGQDVLAFTKIQAVGDPLKEYPYRGWEDLYRKEWTWDKVQFATHSSGCVAGCSWKVYTKDGIPIREEQTSNYPQYAKGVPDMNPRGCQKGGCFTSWMLAPEMLKYPLKRIGARGEGKWKRISWDEAYDEIADKLIDVTLKDPGSIANANRYFRALGKAAGMRLAALLGGETLAVSAFVGDLYPGTHTTRVEARTVSTFDDWFTSDLIISWAKNIVPLRIPDAHFAMEAKYNGGRFVAIDVTYSPTATKADLWMPVKMGTDSHLAASIVNILINEKLYKEDYIKVHTDLPFLVRKDTGKFLTGKDFKSDAKEFIYYLWDKKTGKAVEAPGTMDSANKTVKLEGIDPAIEGIFKVELPDGKEVEVTTVFENIRKEIAPFTPETTQKTTGVHPSNVRKLTKWIAESKALRILQGYNLEKHFDGHQTSRLIMLIHCLTGHQGTTGSVDTTYEGWSLGPYSGLRNVGEKKSKSTPGVLAEWDYGDHAERSKTYFDQKELKEKLGFDVDGMVAYKNEAEAKGWMPKAKAIPKVMFWEHCNYFRHIAGENHFREKALPKVDLIVMTDIRVASSGLWADILLPTAGDYEVIDARETSVTPYLHAFLKPVDPLFERKSEWQIFVELSKRVQEKAKTRGIGSIPYGKVTIDLHTMYDEFTMNGKIANDEDAIKHIFEKAKALGMERYKEFIEKGFCFIGPEAGKTTPIPSDRPHRPFVKPVAEKTPIPTNTGRFQFYVDHDWYLKLNMAVPKPQYSGGDLGPKKFPFVMDYPHTRWGIHSQYRTEKRMMRLQRGTVYIYLNPDVMARKGIKDGDAIRTFNDHGEFWGMAKAWPGLPEYIVFHEHGWEAHLTPKRMGYNSVNADILNPLAMIGKHGHIKYIGGNFNPNRIYYETRVDIEKVEIPVKKT